MRSGRAALGWNTPGWLSTFPVRVNAVLCSPSSLCRRLARRASLSGHDPCLPCDFHGVVGEEERGVAVEAVPEASASWCSRLNLAVDHLPEDDVLELEYGEDEDGASDLLILKDEGQYLRYSSLGCTARDPHRLSGWR